MAGFLPLWVRHCSLSGWDQTFVTMRDELVKNPYLLGTILPSFEKHVVPFT